MRLVFDAEANDLYEGVTRLHCIATHNLDTEETRLYKPWEVIEGLHYLMEADELIGHSIIDYDFRMFKKLFPWFSFKGKVLDTLVLSQLMRQDRWGGHGLEAWGKRAGRHKPEHKDWSIYTPAMGHRCQEDVAINVFTYYELQKEAGDPPIEGVRIYE